MKFQVEHEALTDAVAWVARALPSRPVVPVLSGLRLEAGDGTLALSCFDYELSATARVPADVSEPGSALVPGRLLAEITRSLPGQPAEFSSVAGEISLACGSAEFVLVSLPEAEYPALPQAPPLAGTVDGGELAAAVAQVLPAASRDDTLPILTAICLDLHGAVVRMAATDRYRMAVRELPWQPAQPGLRAVALVPARMLADAARSMAPGVPVSVSFAAGPAPAEAGPAPGAGEPGESGSGQGGEASLGTGGPGAGRRGGDPKPSEGMIAFESGGRRLTGRLIGGEFIRYESRFPASFGCWAELPAASFTEAVRRVSLVADRASPVRLAFGPGQVVVEAQTEGRARAAETVTASFHGDEPAIAFNPHFLLDGLTAAAAGAAPAGGDGQPGKAAGTAAGVRIEFTSAAKPALITPATWAGPAVPGQEIPQPAGQAAGGGAGGAAAGDGRSGDITREDGAGEDGPGGAGESAAGPGETRGAGGSTPVFRYLVVPLRPPVRS